MTTTHLVEIYRTFEPPGGICHYLIARIECDVAPRRDNQELFIKNPKKKFECTVTVRSVHFIHNLPQAGIVALDEYQWRGLQSEINTITGDKVFTGEELYIPF